MYLIIFDLKMFKVKIDMTRRNAEMCDYNKNPQDISLIS